MTDPTRQAVLSVRDLDVVMHGNGQASRVVRKLCFDLQAGEVLALVGESGCGKSKTAEAIMGLIPQRSGTVSAARIELAGSTIHGLPEAAMRRIRGREISMVFQEPLTALDPVFTCGSQLAVLFRRHRGQGRSEARASSERMLQQVGFADEKRVMRSYPHQLSGGMRQRVIVAMAMACRPQVLIADEPTTALDVTTQAQVLQKLTRLGRDAGTAILLITHDLGIVAQYCDRALVMHDGRIVEESDIGQLFSAPVSDYTRELVAAAQGVSL